MYLSEDLGLGVREPTALASGAMVLFDVVRSKWRIGRASGLDCPTDDTSPLGQEFRLPLKLLLVLEGLEPSLPALAVRGSGLTGLSLVI